MTAAFILSTITIAHAAPKDGQQWGGDGHQKIRRVLLLSIDGMHATVSVGHELIEKSLSPTVTGGYVDAIGTPTAALLS